MAVDCSVFEPPADDSITCITNAYPMSGAVPETVAVSVVVPDKGRAAADAALFTYQNLWSAKTTWGGNDPPRVGDSVVVTYQEYIVLDESTPELHLVILQVLVAYIIESRSPGHYHLLRDPLSCPAYSNMVIFCRVRWRSWMRATWS